MYWTCTCICWKLKDVNGVFCDFSVHCIHTHYFTCTRTCITYHPWRSHDNGVHFLLCEYFQCKNVSCCFFPRCLWKVYLFVVSILIVETCTVHVMYGNVSTCSNIWQRDLDGAACYKVNRKVKVDKTTRHANVSMV